VKAHAQPVQALWTRTAGRGIISGTKRGIIMVWDQTLTKQYEVDTRDLDMSPRLFFEAGPAGGPAIISVCESPEGKLLFGTRRAEIAEIQPYKKG
jgi:microtubule-associated protein-like 6